MAIAIAATTAKTMRTGSQTMTNQIPASATCWTMETRLARAWSTAAAGSQPLVATYTATTGAL